MGLVYNSQFDSRVQKQIFHSLINETAAEERDNLHRQRKLVVCDDCAERRKRRCPHHNGIYQRLSCYSGAYTCNRVVRIKIRVSRNDIANKTNKSSASAEVADRNVTWYVL